MNHPPNDDAADLAGARRRDTSGQIWNPKATPSTNHDQVELPEHRNDRRRFVVWAVLGGFCDPSRLTERIVAEVAEILP